MLKEKIIEPDCIDQVKYLLANTHDIQSYNSNINNYHKELFVQIAPHYGFALGYGPGPENENNHTVILYIYEKRDSDKDWTIKDWNIFNNTGFFKTLVSIKHKQPYGRDILSSDLLFIYHRIDPQGYKPYNDEYKNIHARPYLLNKILQRSKKRYLGKYCMGMWLCWAYLTMIAEYYPKKGMGHSMTGDNLMEMGIYKCLYTHLTPSKIAGSFTGKNHNELNSNAHTILHKWEKNVYEISIPF